MTRDEMKQILRDQKAGFEMLRRFNIEEARRATFDDRLAGLLQVLRFCDAAPVRATRTIDDSVARRWEKIRSRYAETTR